MKPSTWVIIGASSAIAQQFAHCAAEAGHPLLLVGRDKEALELIAADLRLRYHQDCDLLLSDLSTDIIPLLAALDARQEELALFLASSDIIENNALNWENIETMLRVNVISLAQIIHRYWQRNQSQHKLIFLSSVAASRGRTKNSLYGGSKAAIEIYLEGLQQTATPTQDITIARLGFIDTVQTYGLPGIFYASPPEACAKACWKAINAHKRFIYHPFFWRYIMMIIKHLPFVLYKRVKA